jgi:shikimate kinase
LKRHLALVGFMASGKSTIGRKLARRLGWSFVDTDVLVVRAHGPIAAIFADEGEAAFRRYEHLAICTALARDEASVVALGGGALTLTENRKVVRDAAYRIFIKVSAEQVYARVRRSRELRPVLGRLPTLDRIRELYAGRMAEYERADYVVEASRRSDADVISAILSWLHQRTPAAGTRAR